MCQGKHAWTLGGYKHKNRYKQFVGGCFVLQISQTTSSETATSPSNEEAEPESDPGASFQSTLKGFLPYSSSMLQSMKSMTTQTFSNIQTYVTKQMTEPTDSAPSTDTPLRHTPTGSSPTNSMSTSLDSLPEGVQDSSLPDARAVKGSNSGSVSPVKEPSPGESRVSKKSQSLRTIWAKQDQLGKKIICFQSK